MTTQVPKSRRTGKRVPIIRSAEPNEQLGEPALNYAGLSASQTAELALARHTYALRRRRHKFLSPDLFGEPTWDILLDLFIAAHEGRRVPTTSACIGAHVPPTTALRWLRILEARGLVEREEDGRDGRRTFVKLSKRGVAAMSGFMQASLASLQLSVLDLRGSEPEAFALAAE
jgi:DNA-binding transcriptional ArsR family regulator